MNPLSIQRILFPVLAIAAFFAVHATEPTNLIEDGDFEASDGIPSAAWLPNSSYPGEIHLVKDKSKAHAGERFLRVRTPDNARDPQMGTGVILAQKFPRTVENYRFQIFCRGDAKVLVNLSAWGKTQWICSSPYSKWLDVASTDDWNLYEGKIRVPEQLESVQSREKENVVNLQLCLYVRGEVDIDDIILTEAAE